ncbi:MAG: TetR/AcrR family transcriptional regulator [Proteobacteria bacterium]|nr:TetR/AcrR family transcriptional regulator [Pseudomonadota bacterium]
MNAKRMRDPEATRASLLIAAEEVFLEKGFGNTSISDISGRAGITKSLIHHYFGSKEGIWQAVKQRRFNYYSDRQLKMLENSELTLGLLRESFILYFHFLKSNPEIVRILAWMFLERDQDDCVHKDRELVEKGIERIKSGQKMGQIRSDIDPKFILFTFIGMCQHWFQDKEHFILDFCGGEKNIPEDLDELYLDAIQKIFFEGISPK